MRKFLACAMLALFVSLAGCSSPPQLGDLIDKDAASVAALLWIAGNLELSDPEVVAAFPWLDVLEIEPGVFRVEAKIDGKLIRVDVLDLDEGRLLEGVQGPLPA